MQRWGQGWESALGQVCTHDHMVLDVTVCLNATWLSLFLGGRDGPHKLLLSELLKKQI